MTKLQTIFKISNYAQGRQLIFEFAIIEIKKK